MNLIRTNILIVEPPPHATSFPDNIDISNNKFRNNLNDMCQMSVFEYGELVELRADCSICNCYRLCRTCRDNKDFKYEYDDDDWEFDDDGRYIQKFVD